MQASDRIYIAGHNGMVGSAVCQELKVRGYTNLITASHHELELIDQAATRAFIQREKPDSVSYTHLTLPTIYSV